MGLANIVYPHSYVCTTIDLICMYMYGRETERKRAREDGGRGERDEGGRGGEREKEREEPQ